jgi:hypothetical protein
VSVPEGFGVVPVPGVGVMLDGLPVPIPGVGVGLGAIPPVPIPGDGAKPVPPPPIPGEGARPPPVPCARPVLALPAKSTAGKTAANFRRCFMIALASIAALLTRRPPTRFVAVERKCRRARGPRPDGRQIKKSDEERRPTRLWA